MSKRLSEKEFGHALSGVFSMLSTVRAQEPRISVAEIQAVIAVAMSTLPTRTNLAAVREIADKLQMSPSGASRVLANLSDPEGLALLTSYRGVQGRRAEAYVLTEKGRSFVAEMVAAMTNTPKAEFGQFEAHTIESYAEDRWINKLETAKLRKVNWNEDALTLVVAPCEAIHSEEVQEWISDFLSPSTTIKKAGDGAASIQFETITDAVYFTLRWC
jgi:DNA-binding MarR family transcriptional regulator